MAKSLLEKLKDVVPLDSGLPCGMVAVLDSLNPKDKEDLLSVMSVPARNSSMSNQGLHRFLISEGHKIAYSSVRLHRSKKCRCFKTKDRKPTISRETK